MAQILDARSGAPLTQTQVSGLDPAYLLQCMSYTLAFDQIDGATTLAVAAAKATDTVVKNSGGRLVSVLVTTVGTNAMLIYDNATAGSGTVIGIVPASSAANGVPLVYKFPAANGITIAGNAANPGVTVNFS